MFKIALVVMYSDKYAMTGETHGVSVLAGVVKDKYDIHDANIMILDMYGQQVYDKTSFICEKLKEFQPDIVGFSCPYGSYSTLENDFIFFRMSIPPKSMIIFGGALPTYIPEKYLEIDPRAFVIMGEGEEAIVDLIDCYLEKNFNRIETIPNICYKSNTGLHISRRKLVDLDRVPVPYRNHIGVSINIYSQIYVEHSRGCTWSSCAFCSRNLLSLEGCPKKYRVFPRERLIKDLTTLRQKGIRAVTFADEDFAGNGISEKKELLQIFKTINSSNDLIHFDVSMNVNSIYSDQWDKRTLRDNTDLLLQLKHYGLRKIFLGVESGSISQLKRYRKQQTVSESIKAIRLLEDCNFDIEIGYIVFDPLCTIQEIKDDLLFLNDNDLAKYVSSLGSGLDLRLHMDTPYVRYLKEFEKKEGVVLHSQDYELDTLNYVSSYYHKNVSKMAQYVKEINELIRPIYYPLKSISRYGLNGSLKEDAVVIKSIVIDIRNTYLKYLLQLIDCIEDDSNSKKIVDSIGEYIRILLDDKREMLINIRHRTGNIVLDRLINDFF